jgi:hypothetical protein
MAILFGLRFRPGVAPRTGELWTLTFIAAFSAAMVPFAGLRVGRFGTLGRLLRLGFSRLYVWLRRRRRVFVKGFGTPLVVISLVLFGPSGRPLLSIGLRIVLCL